jgi:hypothetical protein
MEGTDVEITERVDISFASSLSSLPVTQQDKAHESDDVEESSSSESVAKGLLGFQVSSI